MANYFEVVVAGGGPVGLMLACELRSAGVSVLVLERRARPEQAIKAGSMGPLAAEALFGLGLAAELRAAEEAAIARDVQLTGRPGGPREHFGGIFLDPSLASDPDRRRIRIDQPELEALLARHADRLGVEVRREHEVVGLSQDDQGVSVDVSTPDGPLQVRCAYLAGCDGGRSTVRELAGFDFVGTPASLTGRDGVVRLAEEEKAKLARGFHHTDRGVFVFAGFGAERVAAVEFDGPPEDPHAPLTLPDLQASVRRVSGTDVVIDELISGFVYTDEARQATTYRKGRVLLAGDAAHIYAPFGGQGLNVGLVDAANLGWKLAAQIRGWAPVGLLDTYTAERHPVAAVLLHNTRAQAALMRPDPQSRALRELFSGLVAMEAVTRLIVDMKTGQSVRYDLGDAHPLVGTLCPDLPLDGVGGTLRERLGSGWGLLLDLADRAEVRAAAAGWSERIGIVTAQAKIDGVDALLLRPDGCVAWVLPAGAEPEEKELAGALRTWFGEGKTG
ncbi:FAD-dependent monooxygenase [Nonomuraea sp. SYSU D8015]|uniref:FAD-dependent monooxygenase n=1 Tax=Nonomuraea sp. SYSU D8015 TaxID=2593644 RepID=UPI001660CA69|nr:FAD-dependent monooxygenase [Nonomuraea sp. SYSU D8015]